MEPGGLVAADGAHHGLLPVRVLLHGVHAQRGRGRQVALVVRVIHQVAAVDKLPVGVVRDELLVLLKAAVLQGGLLEVGGGGGLDVGLHLGRALGAEGGARGAVGGGEGQHGAGMGGQALGAGQQVAGGGRGDEHGGWHAVQGGREQPLGGEPHHGDQLDPAAGHGGEPGRHGHQVAMHVGHGAGRRAAGRHGNPAAAAGPSQAAWGPGPPLLPALRGEWLVPLGLTVRAHLLDGGLLPGRAGPAF